MRMYARGWESTLEDAHPLSLFLAPNRNGSDRLTTRAGARRTADTLTPRRRATNTKATPTPTPTRFLVRSYARPHTAHDRRVWLWSRARVGGSGQARPPKCWSPTTWAVRGRRIYARGPTTGGPYTVGAVPAHEYTGGSKVLTSHSGTLQASRCSPGPSNRYSRLVPMINDRGCEEREDLVNGVWPAYLPGRLPATPPRPYPPSPQLRRAAKARTTRLCRVWLRATPRGTEARIPASCERQTAFRGA